MGSGKGSQPTVTTSTPNPQAMAAYQNILSRAQGVASTPYTAYGGELVAPVNQQQYQGIGGINSYANFAQPYIQQAAGYAADAATPLTAAQIEQYQSPYTKDVVNATQAQFNNANAQQQQGVISNAAAQGALGGNRVGITQSNLANQQQLAQAPVIAGLENQGYQTALNTALTEQQARAAAAYSMGNLGVSGQNAGLTGANAQIGAGTLEQQNQQARDAALYQQFQLQQAFPYQQTQWLAGIGSGIGSQMGGTSSTQPPTPSPWAQWGGLALAGLGMMAARGGRIKPQGVAHFDDGGAVAGGVAGAPYGGGMPYGGVAGWIPGGMQIAHGPGAPKPPGAPQPANPQQLGQQIGGLAKALMGNGQDTNFGGVNYNQMASGSGVSGSDMAEAAKAGVASGLQFDPMTGNVYARGGYVGRAAGGIANIPFHRRIMVPRSLSDGGAPDDYSDAPDYPATNERFGPQQQFPDIQGFGETEPSIWDRLTGHGLARPYPATKEKFGPAQGFDVQGFGDEPARKYPATDEKFGPRLPLPDVTEASFAPMGLPKEGFQGVAANTPFDASVASSTKDAMPSWMSGINPTGNMSTANAMPLSRGIESIAGIPGAWHDPEAAAPGMPPAVDVKGRPGDDIAGAIERNGIDPASIRWGGSGATPRLDIAGPGPASVRANNPGAQYPSSEAKKFGMEGYGVIGGGHQIAVFPSPVNGAAANMDLFARNYTGMTVGQAGAKWTGNNGFGVPGYDNRMVVTKDMMADPNFAIPFMKAVAGREAGKENPMSDADWSKAHEMFMAGGGSDEGGEGVQRAAYNRENAVLPATARPASGVAPASEVTPSSGIHFSSNSKLGPALMTAGFGMMASRSPYPGVAIGEGGLQGMQTYTRASEQEQARELKKSEIDLHAKNLQRQADQFQQELALKTKHGEDEAKYRQGLLDRDNLRPTGAQTEDGHPIWADSRHPGSAVDAVTGKPVNPDQKIIQTKPGAQVGNAPEDVARRDVQARRIINGDMSAISNIGRGAQGGEELKAIHSRAEHILTDPEGEYRYTPQQAAEYLGEQAQNFKAGQTGKTTAARTAASREENLRLILKVTDAAVPAALEQSEKVWRTGFVPLNKIIQGGEVMVSDPELRKFGMANLQLAESWARAMNPTGVMRKDDRDKALNFLSTADSQDTYRQVVQQLQTQIRREYESIHAPFGSTSGQTAPASQPAASAMNPQDKQAIDWANANPNDPRSVEIKRRLGVQ